MLPSWRSAVCALAITPIMTITCGDPLFISPEVDVLNQPDDFELRVSAMADLSETLAYDWENSGTRARVEQQSALTDGDATLLIEDAAGTIVHAFDLAPDGHLLTEAGVPGTWRVTIAFDDTDGSVHVHLRAE